LRFGRRAASAGLLLRWLLAVGRRSAAFGADGGNADVRSAAATTNDLSAGGPWNGEHALASEVRTHDSDDIFVGWHRYLLW